MSKLMRACAASLSILLLGTSFTAAASAANSVNLSGLRPATNTVRVTGNIQQLVIDNFADDVHDVADHAGSASMITYLAVGDQRIELGADNQELANLAAGSEVVLDLVIPKSSAPSKAAGTHNTLDSSTTQDLAQDLAGPVAAELVEVVEAPSIGTTESTAVHHESVVILPVPSDYAGSFGDCTADWEECTLPAFDGTGLNNGPLGAVQAQSMMDTNASYWTSQTRGAIADMAITKMTHVKVPATEEFMCNGDPNQLMKTLWEPLADQFKIGGYDDSTSHNSLVVFSGACSSYTDGFAYIGGYGIESSSITQIRNANEPTLIHEFGHIFSLGHSDLEIVDGPLSASISTPLDYYGFYSPMQMTVRNSRTSKAFPAPALEGAHEILLGLAHDHEVLKIEEPGQYALTERTGSTGVRTMYINEPGPVSHIIEYRSGIGQDTGTLYANAMSVGYDSHRIDYEPGVRVYSLLDDGSAIKTITTSRYDSANARYQTSFRSGDSLVLYGAMRLNIVSIAGGQAIIEVVDQSDSAITSESVSGSVKSEIALPYSITSSSPTFSGTVRALLDEMVLSEQAVTGANGSVEGSLSLPASLPAGTHSVQLQFVNSPTLNDASTTVSVKVNKRSLTSLTLSAPTSTYAASGKATVTAKGTLTPSGTVKFYVDGKYYKSAAIKSGKASITLSSSLKAGKRSIKAAFPSSSVYNSKTVSTTLTVKKLRGDISGSPTGIKYVKVGSSYSKKVKVNATGKLQRRVDGEWKNIKTLSKGTTTLKFSIGKSTKAYKYRVIVPSTSNVYGEAAKSFIIRPKK